MRMNLRMAYRDLASACVCMCVCVWGGVLIQKESKCKTQMYYANVKRSLGTLMPGSRLPRIR